MRRTSLLTVLFVIGFSVASWAATEQEGYQALINRDYKTALSILKPIAENGDAMAQFAVGTIVEGGFGNPEVDHEEAIKWFRLAAAQDLAEANTTLGDRYSEGRGVAKDLAEAAKWYERGATLGHSVAQSRLANLYYFGEGVAQSYEEAIKYLKLAATQGSAEDQMVLAGLYNEGKVVPRDSKEAFKWLEMAALQSFPPAQVMMGQYYIIGEIFERDLVQAFKWYSIAFNNPDINMDDPDIREEMLGLSQYFAKELTDAQREEGGRLAREWKYDRQN